MAPSQNEKQEIIFEITRIGTIMRITAIDAKTGDEVIVQAPSSLPLEQARLLAARKLAYVIAKKRK